MGHAPKLVLACLLLAVNVAYVVRREPTVARTAAVARVDHGGFRYGTGVTPAHRAAFETAVSYARPEARRLIARVDGFTTVHVGTPGPEAAGVMRELPDRYDVMVDLDGVGATLGPRGVARVVLHELGHVVDRALVPDALMARLDAGIPAGYVCERGHVGSCTEVQERFAESFAKWAVDDIGVGLSIGYKVPPPAMPLATWGAPLATL